LIIQSRSNLFLLLFLELSHPLQVRICLLSFLQHPRMLGIHFILYSAPELCLLIHVLAIRSILVVLR
jgi:hypothetical protein